MSEGKVKKTMMSFYITEYQDACLVTHKTATGESGRALMVRLLDIFFDKGVPEIDAKPDSGNPIVKRSVEIDPDVNRKLQEHRFITGETAAALMRRLLGWYFTNHR